CHRGLDARPRRTSGFLYPHKICAASSAHPDQQNQGLYPSTLALEVHQAPHKELQFQHHRTHRSQLWTKLCRQLLSRCQEPVSASNSNVSLPATNKFSIKTVPNTNLRQHYLSIQS